MKEELHENEENKRTAWQRKGGKNMENIIMKNRPFKRILSVVLAVVMVIILMPLNGMTVQAADGSVTLNCNHPTDGVFSATSSSADGGWSEEEGTSYFMLPGNNKMTISSNNGCVITQVELRVEAYGNNFAHYYNRVTVSSGTTGWTVQTAVPKKLKVTGINNTSLTITNGAPDYVSFKEIIIYSNLPHK